MAKDIHGSDWHAENQSDGTKIWIQSGNGKIRNEGVNKISKEFKQKAELSKPNRDRQKKGEGKWS